MTDLARLVVALEAQTAKYQAGLDAANKKLGKFQADQNRTLGAINKRFSGFASGVKGALAGIGIAFSFKAIIDATTEAEHAFALLDNAVKASGGAAGFTTRQLADMAGELQKVSTFDDEAIMGMQQLLLRFQSINGVRFGRAQKVTLDLATALGKDLASAATMVGKALEAPVKGAASLAKQGVILSEAQKKLIKDMVATGNAAGAQEVILTALEGKYRGAALAARDTLGGALTGLKNAFNDLLEGNGTTGITGTTQAINSLTDLLNSQEVKEGFATLVGGILEVVKVCAEGITGLVGFTKWVGESIAAMGGLDPDDLVRMSDAIVDLQEQIARLEGASSFTTMMFGGKEAVAATIDGHKKKLKELQDQYNAARKAAETRLNAPVTSKAGAPGKAPAAPADPMAGLEEVKVGGMVNGNFYGRKIDTSAMEKFYDDLDARTKTTTEKQSEQISQLEIDLHELWSSGAIDAKEYTARWAEGIDEILPEIKVTAEKVGDTLMKQFNKVNVWWDEFARNTVGVLADGFESVMTGSFDNILKSFDDMLTKMVAQALAKDVGKYLFGEGSGGGVVGKAVDWLGGLFGGVRDSGGRGEPGKAYYIGTGAQPEMFVPDQPGTFVPAGQNGGGGRPINQTIIFQGRQDERTVRQLAIDARRQQQMAMRLS